eukprot:symbB.v1.2.000188.t1/scaffold21.1/size436794/7
MEERGVLKPNELDNHAQAQLRKADPDIALEALSQWETSSYNRRNPSACMVSLLKKLNEQGLVFLQRKLPEPLVDEYLARLQVCRDTPSLESLQSLLAAHVDRVIYENLDIQLGRALPPLSFEESAQRVAVKCRGGYCFLLRNTRA